LNTEQVEFCGNVCKRDQEGVLRGDKGTKLSRIIWSPEKTKPNQQEKLWAFLPATPIVSKCTPKLDEITELPS